MNIYTKKGLSVYLYFVLMILVGSFSLYAAKGGIKGAPKPEIFSKDVASPDLGCFTHNRFHSFFQWI